MLQIKEILSIFHWLRKSFRTICYRFTNEDIFTMKHKYVFLSRIKYTNKQRTKATRNLASGSNIISIAFTAIICVVGRTTRFRPKNIIGLVYSCCQAFPTHPKSVDDVQADPVSDRHSRIKTHFITQQTTADQVT